MKKSTIWVLTILMAITFLGLLSVQIMYMRNMIQMRYEQFSEGVHRALANVADKIQRDETRYFYQEDVVKVETPAQVITQYNDGSLPLHNGIKNSVTAEKNGYRMSVSVTYPMDGDSLNLLTGDPINVYDTGGSQYELANPMGGEYHYHKRILDEIILNIIAQASNRKINERADTAVVRNYLKEELTNNGINQPFEFAIVDKAFNPVLSTSAYRSVSAEATDTFVQPLFPYDPAPKKVLLRAVFPDRQGYIVQSVKFMLPSLAFTFILLVVFLFTIILAFRQKKLTEMKNDFINNMTHEFKTPISSISLAAQMLNDDSVRKSPAMMQHISTVINDETKRLRFQVEKVLQMSMFDRQKATLRLTEIDANAAIANIVNTFKLKVERYGGHLASHLDAPDAIVNVDEMHFTNVIFNLLDNAVKYRKEDTALELNVTTANIPGDRLEIVIADNGIGIRKDDLKKIFEKFYRVPTGNIHDVKGFGLGLAYVQKMVNELHGEIKVESEINVGTKFIIILPLIKN